MWILFLVKNEDFSVSKIFIGYDGTQKNLTKTQGENT
jgi:hypothetical protein